MIRTLSILTALVTFSACATTSPPTPPPAPPPVEVEPDDAFSSFGGQVIALGETVTVRREPV